MHMHISYDMPYDMPIRYDILRVRNNLQTSCMFLLHQRLI